MRFKSPFGA